MSKLIDFKSKMIYSTSDEFVNEFFPYFINGIWLYKIYW